ncbi:MAG: hypothetical protein F6K47_29460 [Symploca sp. SIO2E6]|nr:hypothetical protein [Symploca sp. SIO2E6]
MRVWISGFLVLLGIVELYRWLKDFTVPLPVFIVGGALLAIASNYGKYSGWSFGGQSDQSEANEHLSTTNTDSLTNTPNQEQLNQSTSTPVVQSPRSISFTITRHEIEN